LHQNLECFPDKSSLCRERESARRHFQSESFAGSKDDLTVSVSSFFDNKGSREVDFLMKAQLWGKKLLQGECTCESFQGQIDF